MEGDFLIAYGSHTGQAEAISAQLKEKAELVGLRPRVQVLNENEKQFHLEKEPFVVIVISSTGDGDAPENCSRFMRRIHRKTLEMNFLSGVDYALLGLGDSNYSSYQAIPSKLDKQLQHLGATRVMETGVADDQVGLELSVEPWIDQLFQVLAKRFSIPDEKLSVLSSTKVSFNPVKSKEEKDKIGEEQELTSTSSEDEVESQKDMLNILSYEYPEVSVRKGDAKLSADPNLRVPIAPQPFLTSSVSHKAYDHTKENSLVWQNNCKMVGIVSTPVVVPVVGTTLLTQPNVAKPKREIVLDLGEQLSSLPYLPGDAFYFIAPNPVGEVNFILERMGLLSVAERQLKITVDTSTKKLNPTVPPHIPPNSSLRYLFTYCLDIRRAPGRPLLRILADRAKDDSERRRLLELCSAQGMNDFTTFVRQAALSMADVLLAFPSVQPDVNRLIELLPRLIPRPYSVASARGARVRFVYSIMDFPVEQGRRYTRKGLTSEWLTSLRVDDQIQIMAKEPARFRLPPPGVSLESVSQIPLLMIGPGTGVAVFLAFCQHLLKTKLENPSSFPSVPRYLYFGCRDLNKDYIYRDELESYVREGILTDLIVCESQGAEDSTRPKYVQDALKQHIDEVHAFMSSSEEKGGRVYVCGDAKGMSKDVWNCFHDIVQKTGLSADESKAYMLKMKKEDRYIEDVWS